MMEKIKLFYIVPKETFDKIKGLNEKVRIEEFLVSQPKSAKSKMKRILNILAEKGIKWDQYGNVSSPFDFNLTEMLMPAVRQRGSPPANYKEFLMLLKKLKVPSYYLCVKAEILSDSMKNGKNRR